MTDVIDKPASERKKHSDVLFYCWLLGTVFTMLALATLLQMPGMFLATGVSCFMAALITAIDEPAAVSSQNQSKGE